jgi:hypothetical protein
VITSVPKHYFHVVWDEAKEHLLRFERMTGGKYDVDDLGKMILEEKQQLWIVADNGNEIVGAVVTQVFDTPNKKIMEIFACAGNGMDEYLYEIMKELEEFARLNYCDLIRVEGRKGWSKVLKPYGFEETSIIVERRL